MTTLPIVALLWTLSLLLEVHAEQRETLYCELTDPIPSPHSRGHHLAFCVTKSRKADATRITVDLNHPFGPLQRNSYNVFTVTCALYSIKCTAPMTESKNLVSHRRGCSVYRFESDHEVWRADIEPHTECSFICSVLTGEFDPSDPLPTRLRVYNTNNPTDVAYVYRRRYLESGAVYQTFCFLSGYNMVIFHRENDDGVIPNENVNGYCQLYVDEHWWRAAAWKSAVKAAGTDCHASCDVTCQHVKMSDNVDINEGVMITHAIYRKSTTLIPADDATQCTLSHVNIQPIKSTQTQDIGCRLNIRPDSQWELIVERPSDESSDSVECGVVCSCSSTTRGSWPCIIDETRLEVPIDPFSIWTNRIYSFWTVGMLAVVVVLSLYVLYRQFRKESKKSAYA